MPITRLTTWAAGNILTATDLNAEFNNITTQTARLTGAETITGVWTFNTDPVFTNANAIPWAKVSKTGSTLADLATRSAADLSSGSLSLARIAAGTDGQVLKTVSGATAWGTGIRPLVGPFETAGALVASTTYSLPFAPGDSPQLTGTIVSQAGSVTGVTYLLAPDGVGGYTNRITAGAVDIRVHKNYTEVWTASTLTSASAARGTVTQASGLTTAVANDVIGINLVTNGTYAESSALFAFVWLEYTI